MNELLRVSKKEQKALFEATAISRKMTPGMVEKDFWVCWTLDYLFQQSPWKDQFSFKGGTSLSKCYGLIDRFSEDIDLIIDWRLIGCGKDEPWRERSRTQQDRYNKDVNARTGEFLRNELVPGLQKVFRELIHDDFILEIDSGDPQTVCFSYPRLFDDNAILPVIRLETGPLAAWTPTQNTVVTPFVAEQYPHVFKKADTTVRAVSPERTFWEKVLILHKMAFRSDGRVPERYSRHYYDLWCMANSPVKQAALQEPKLLRRVVKFNDRFYYAASAHYELAEPGSLQLMPNSACLGKLRKDYEHMQSMIYGPKPDFDEILDELEYLEEDINLMRDPMERDER